MKKDVYKVGSIVTGCVTGVQDYGIFVSLDDYYSGLIHISEISNSFVKNVNDYVSLGETIRVRILEINEDTFHLKLSIKEIDYRICNRKREKIKETSKGFSTLKVSLENWIEKREKSIFVKKI